MPDESARRDGRVSEDVHRGRGKASGLPVPLERCAQPLRMNGPADLVGEDQVGVVVGVSRELPLEQLQVAVAAERGDRGRVERTLGRMTSTRTGG